MSSWAGVADGEGYADSAYGHARPDMKISDDGGDHTEVGEEASSEGGALPDGLDLGEVDEEPIDDLEAMFLDGALYSESRAVDEVAVVIEDIFQAYASGDAVAAAREYVPVPIEPHPAPDPVPPDPLY